MERLMGLTLTKAEKEALLAEISIDEQIEWMLKERDHNKTWRGKLSKLRKDFVQSLNPKHIKKQRAKIKEEYEMSNAEVEETLQQLGY